MVRIDVNFINELIKSSNEIELEKQFKHLSSMNTKSRIVSVIDIIDDCDDISFIKNHLIDKFEKELYAIKLVNRNSKDNNNTSEELTEEVLKIFKSENWEIY